MSKKLGSGALHLTISKMLMMVLSLVTGMLLSRFRTLEEYGTYSQLMIIINTATAFVMLGLPNSTNFFLARAETSEEKRDFLSVYYTFNTFLCVVLGAVLVIIVPFVEKYFKNDTISNFSYFLAVYPWAHITFSSISNVLVVYGKTIKLILLNLAVSAVSLASVIIIQLLGLTFNDYMIAFLIGNVLIAIVIYIIVYRLEKGIKLKVDISLIKKILAYSIPIGLASLVGTLNIEMDKLMIGRLMDTESLAVYTNAGRELPLTMVATSLTAVLLPQMARQLKNNENEKAIKLWGVAIDLSYIIMAFFVTACIVFAPQVMTLLYSQKYIGGVSVFRIYSLVLLLRVTYFGIILNAVGKTKFIFWSSIISLGINVVLNYLLFVIIGFTGPAWATFFSIGVVGLLQLIVSAKVIGVSFKNIFPWLEILKITLINVAWGIICYLLLRILEIGTSDTHIIISVSIGLFVTLIYILIFKKKIAKLWKKLNSEN